MSDCIEVKAEGIGEAADAGEVAALREEVAGLKARVEAGALRAGRAPLDGIKAAGGGAARSAFVERYLRRGLDAGVEMKSVTGTTGADGGFAVPREIDEAIEALLKTISPIRAIASVVATGSAGYRKLVAAGGTPSGWASETAPRPETATPVGARPVRAITLVEGLPADGAAVLLPVDAYAIDLDSGGQGLVRVMRPGISGRMRVTYRAGLATSAGEVPEALRQGIMLRAAQILRLRDDAEAGASDGAEALWAPWRRLRLG